MNSHYEQHRSSVRALSSLDPTPSFLVGGGKAGALVRSTDWGATALGPIGAWPQSLRTAIGICLNSRFPVALYWGPEFVMFYNDDLLPMVGGNEHPRAMGRPGLEVLAEIRDLVEPLLRRVTETGEATWSEDLMLPLLRGDVQAESYFSFSYSPIRDETGGVGGVFCAVMETTARVIEERRLRLLDALAGAARAETPERAFAHAAAELAMAPADVPFALLYEVDPATGHATLASASNMQAGAPRAPASISAGDASVWPLDGCAGGAPRFLAFDDEPGARGAVVLPIEGAEGERPSGFLVAGLAPLLPRSESHDRFHRLLAASISQIVSRASAYGGQCNRTRALAELDRSKTAFFGNVSHEFRTPLTLLLGPSADALEDATLTGVERERWQLVHRNAQRLQKLVNALLEFSRVEAGHAQARYRPTDLAALTTDLASAFRSAIERAGLAFAVDCPDLPLPAYVDHDMWEKIVLNLLSNALKFTPAGAISLTLRARAGLAELRVCDTGGGIAERHLDDVFERFHRIDGAPPRTHEGSGVGLALVQELVRLHGGSIGVTSEPGRGSVFTVAIPTGMDHLPPDRVDQWVPRAPLLTETADAFVTEALSWLPDGSRSGLGGAAPFIEDGPMSTAPPSMAGRVLVVDDNADMRAYVTRILETRWTVDAVANGEGARRRLANAPYDLVLTDVMMPGADGFGLLEEVRSDPRLASLPVIMLSARAGDEARVEGLHAGADDYLVKPFSARELLARVSTHVALGRARRELDLARRRAQSSEAQYRAVIDNLPELAWNAGPDGHTDFYNRRWYEYTGLTPEETVGWGWMKVHDPELLPQVIARWEHCLETGERFEMEFPLRGADGTFRWFLTRVVPFRDASGAIVRWFGINTNIDQQREATRKAEEASRMKDEFLATASHELRTPLNAILGWARLLRNGQLDDAARLRAVSTIERNAVAQVQLIEDILDGSRIITGKFRLEIAPLDIKVLVAAAVDALRPAADTKRIALSVTMDADANEIMGDAERLQQIVSNLANNAIKFTPAGGMVDVHLQRVGATVQLVVSDSGQGISASFLPHVFERFRQAEGSTSRRHGGLGLGLALVHHLVEAHGGTVRAESEGEGRGARFTVTMPARVACEATPADAPRETPMHASEAFTRLDGVTVLVVDDEADGRDLVAAVLRLRGAEVVTASSAAEALELLARRAPTVLVSDIGMPGTDGYEFIRRVRALKSEAASVPAIALTAYAHQQDRRLALEAGFHRHVVKPVEPAELLRVVRKLVP